MTLPPPLQILLIDSNPLYSPMDTSRPTTSSTDPTLSTPSINNDSVSALKASTPSAVPPSTSGPRASIFANPSLIRPSHGTDPRPTIPEEYSSKSYATLELFEWLARQPFDPSICFYEELNMYDHYTGEVLGLKKITISESTHKNTPCYHVQVQVNWKLNNKQEILEAKLQPWLQLISSTLQTLKDGLVQTFIAYEASDDGRIVSSDGGDTNDHMPLFHIGKSEAVRFLCEASWYPLCRLIANDPTSFPTTSMSFMGVGRKKPVRINAQVDHDKTSQVTMIKFEADPRIDYPRNEARVLGLATAEIVVNAAGRCTDIHYPSIYWAKKPFKVGETKKESDPFSSQNFNNNMELISEYNSVKDDISKSHKVYVQHHPELYDLMSDYLQWVLHKKPHDVYAFTLDYFSSRIN